MSWSLTASGHAETPEKELELAAALGTVLAEAGTAVSSAQFYSMGQAGGDPRSLASPPPTAERSPDGSQDDTASPAAGTGG